MELLRIKFKWFVILYPLFFGFITIHHTVQSFSFNFGVANFGMTKHIHHTHHYFDYYSYATTTTTTTAGNNPLSSLSMSSSSSSSSSSSPVEDKMSSPAYVVIEAKITDREKFSDYAQIVPSIVKQYGGEYIVLGGKHIPLEGEWGYSKNDTDIDTGTGTGTDIEVVEKNQKEEDEDERLQSGLLELGFEFMPEEKDVETKIVLQKWPNLEMAELFWNSPEYAQVKKLREGTGTFRIMLVGGLPVDGT